MPPSRRHTETRNASAGSSSRSRPSTSVANNRSNTLALILHSSSSAASGSRPGRRTTAGDVDVKPDIKPDVMGPPPVSHRRQSRSPSALRETSASREPDETAAPRHRRASTGFSDHPDLIRAARHRVRPVPPAPVAPVRTFPEALGRHLDKVTSEVRRLVGTADGTLRGAVRVIFEMQDEVEEACRLNYGDDIVCLTPAAHMPTVLWMSHDLLIETLQWIPEQRQTSWVPHRADMVEALKMSGVSSSDAVDAMTKARRAWGSYAALSTAATNLNRQFDCDPPLSGNAVRPLVSAIADAAVILVRECWPAAAKTKK